MVRSTWLGTSGTSHLRQLQFGRGDLCPEWPAGATPTGGLGDSRQSPELSPLLAGELFFKCRHSPARRLNNCTSLGSSQKMFFEISSDGQKRQTVLLRVRANASQTLETNSICAVYVCTCRHRPTRQLDMLFKDLYVFWWRENCLCKHLLNNHTCKMCLKTRQSSSKTKL